MSSDELARALRRVPVFPLPNAVLFPHALMPLHVFEPRYRRMTRDALDGHKLMIVARLLEPERPDAPPPRFAPIAGVGEIVLAQEMPDGRFNLVLRGRARVRVDEELAAHTPYRQVAATPLADEPVRTVAEVAEAESSLRALVGGLADALPDGGALLAQVAAAQTTAAALADVLAAALVPDADLRQELLETRDVLVRLERLTGEVAGITGRLRPDGRVN